MAGTQCPGLHLLGKDRGDQAGLGGNGALVLILGGDLQRVDVVLAVGRDLDHFTAQGTGQRAVLPLGVDDDNIVVGGKGHVQDLRLHVHAFAGAGDAQNKSVGIGQFQSVADKGILGDLVDSAGQAAGVLDLLRPERDRHGAALRGKRVQGVDAPEAVGQSGVQSVLLLETGRGNVAKMLLANSDQAFRVGVQFLQTVGGMDKGNEGEDHALVVLGQIIHKSPGVLPLLFHGPGALGGKVVPAVLPLLPAGNVCIHPQDDALHLLDRFVRGNRDHVNGKDQVTGILGQIGNEIVCDKGGIGTQEQPTSEAVSKLKVIALEADGVRANEIPKVLAGLHVEVIVIVEILLISGSEKVMEDTQPVIVVGRGDTGIQTGKGLLQVSSRPAEIRPALGYLALRDGERHKALLHQVVALRRPPQHDGVGLLPVMIQPVVLIRQQDAPLKLSGVEPVIDNGDLGRDVSGQGVERSAVGFEDVVLGLVRGGNVIHVCESPAPAVLPAYLPNAVGVDAPDGDALLDGVRDSDTHALAFVGYGKGLNQNRHAPFG